LIVPTAAAGEATAPAFVPGVVGMDPAAVPEIPPGAYVQVGDFIAALHPVDRTIAAVTAL
jgi:hypothetical protein